MRTRAADRPGAGAGARPRAASRRGRTRRGRAVPRPHARTRGRVRLRRAPSISRRSDWSLRCSRRTSTVNPGRATVRRPLAVFGSTIRSSPYPHRAGGHQGMRRGEILAVRWADLDLDERVVRVSRASSGSTQRQMCRSGGGARVHDLRRVEGPLAPVCQVLAGHRPTAGGVHSLTSASRPWRGPPRPARSGAAPRGRPGQASQAGPLKPRSNSRFMIAFFRTTRSPVGERHWRSKK